MPYYSETSAIESATILGEGKIEELSAAAKDLDAQLIIFDMEAKLKPDTQYRGYNLGACYRPHNAYP